MYVWWEPKWEIEREKGQPNDMIVESLHKNNNNNNKKKLEQLQWYNHLQRRKILLLIWTTHGQLSIFFSSASCARFLFLASWTFSSMRFLLLLSRNFPRYFNFSVIFIIEFSWRTTISWRAQIMYCSVRDNVRENNNNNNHTYIKNKFNVFVIEIVSFFLFRARWIRID